MKELEQAIIEARENIVKKLALNNFEFPIKIKIVENSSFLAQYIHGSILDGEIKIQISSNFENEILKHGLQGNLIIELENTIAHEVIHSLQNIYSYHSNTNLDYNEEEAESLARSIVEGINIENSSLIKNIIPFLEDDENG